MKGHADSIKLLNEILRFELTAINIYFVQAKMAKNWGYAKLNAMFQKESIEEMKHAELVIDRILYLEGIPNMAAYNKMRLGSDVQKQLQINWEMEKGIIDCLNNGIKKMVAIGDNGTREMAAKILVEEEEHADWIESQLHAISEVGLARYLTEHLHA
ncbi:MAG: bacterioferritin [Candidatus Lindowbacteria bacterium RIFCSPLOWO2_12_FULL_62_27]|nr:MAG: bacterioferritin [Candidatus Lindowbacteria bacterium RIFCSPLOWO2_02_FULL_62_12]OGH59029.1 MAG: bacterioferritin [Candidatus Lindowbacteria bacterium RIFCSPLOWO2_12_FULL_62_27]